MDIKKVEEFVELYKEREKVTLDKYEEFDEMYDYDFVRKAAMNEMIDELVPELPEVLVAINNKLN